MRTRVLTATPSNRPGEKRTAANITFARSTASGDRDADSTSTPSTFPDSSMYKTKLADPARPSKGSNKSRRGSLNGLGFSVS